MPRNAAPDQYAASIGADEPLKAGFGAGLYEGAPIGISFLVVPAGQPRVPLYFKPCGDETAAFADESDAGPVPVPPDAPVEGGPAGQGDRHVPVVDQATCFLHEFYRAAPNRDGSWNAVALATFDLRSNTLRPRGWTSADAAGLPILPGLARYEEVAAGQIAHALRFTAPRTAPRFVWPARHAASREEDADLPPLRLRFRLKADVDISVYSPANQVILTAMKTYGLILADNGSPWFVSGAPHPAWNNDELQGELKRLKGSDFEAVDTTPQVKDADSGEAAQ